MALASLVTELQGHVSFSSYPQLRDLPVGGKKPHVKFMGTLIGP